MATGFIKLQHIPGNIKLHSLTRNTAQTFGIVGNFFLCIQDITVFQKEAETLNGKIFGDQFGILFNKEIMVTVGGITAITINLDIPVHSSFFKNQRFNFLESHFLIIDASGFFEL